MLLEVLEKSLNLFYSYLPVVLMCIFRWLDEGEDDHKIVRELRVQDEYMDDILEKRNVSVAVHSSGCSPII